MMLVKMSNSTNGNIRYVIYTLGQNDNCHALTK
jgi:hypothetical protein